MTVRDPAPANQIQHRREGAKALSAALQQKKTNHAGAEKAHVKLYV